MTTIGTLEKSAIEEIRIALSEYKGRHYLDIRTYFGKEGETRIPTRKGVSLSPEKIADLIKMLRLAEQRAFAQGLVKPESTDL